jgi:CheY-like chemotaxis protein
MSSQKTVAVIDDDADFQNMMEDLLRDHGYRVVGFPIGEGAYQVIKDLAVSLVILDIRLPGVSGYHVLNRLLTDPETTHIPVLVCTGESWSIQDRERLLKEMGVPVLLKPFDLDDLLAQVARLTEKSRTAWSGNA